MYFHENQLKYPQRVELERDYQLSWMQVLSALVADDVVFNSVWNRDSFLQSIDGLMKRIPDGPQRVLGLADAIAPKCRVVYFPVDVPSADGISDGVSCSDGGAGVVGEAAAG